MSGRFEPVEITVERVGRSTDKAVLCWVDKEKHWFPFSQLRDPDDPDRELSEADRPEEGDEDVTLYIARWLAEEKGLV